MEFNEVVRTLSGGQTEMAATEQLSALVKLVKETGKPGTFTLTLKVKPNGDDSVIIENALTSKEPTPTRSTNIFYVDGGNLSRNKPNQLYLDEFDTDPKGTNR